MMMMMMDTFFLHLRFGSFVLLSEKKREAEGAHEARKKGILRRLERSQMAGWLDD